MDERRQTIGARWWIAAVLAGATVVVAQWWSSRDDAGDCCEGVRVAAGPAARSATTTAPRAAPAEPAPPMPAGAPHRVAAGTAEVCGYGEVQLPPDDPDPVQRIPSPLRQAALDAMDALMLASDDVQVRAAALWMGARLRGRDVPGRIEQVARLAAGSQDPFVYAMALEACRGLAPADAGSCQLLSAAQWVRLDPDNAVPWRVLADQAHASDEAQVETSALALAARALRNDVYAGRLPHLVERALGARVSALQRTLALDAAWSADAVWSASHGLGVGDAAGAAVTQGIDLSCEGVARRQGFETSARTG